MDQEFEYFFQPGVAYIKKRDIMSIQFYIALITKVWLISKQLFFLKKKKRINKILLFELLKVLTL